MRKLSITLLLILAVSASALASRILIPMDKEQTNHLKAYGLAYWVIAQGESLDWLLNFRGGSFLLRHSQKFENELIIRGVSYDVISEGEAGRIIEGIADPSSNMDLMKLEKEPRIAVYSPKNKQPWDDAVTLVLTYAEIPYDVIFDDEVMHGELNKYDWLHLHHEDFTGQYGKFYNNYRYQPWYIKQQQEFENLARKHGHSKVSHLKLDVVKKIQAFVGAGGFLFAMCSATDTFDIALAADGTDICEKMYDGDGADPKAQSKLRFENTLAFKDFKIKLNPLEYEFSNIDQQDRERGLSETNDFFNLFTFSAKWDPIPTMLTQNHVNTVRGFMGQTTAYKKRLIKSDVVIMGENKSIDEARYIHGILGKGFWTFYGGHDPEDYKHFVGEEPTDLNLHPNSPGYRLILNNILFPAAKKKKQKT
ncbi:asparagine synthetase B [Fulvitalea axinellae]